ncbi:MAG: hypothetical protein ACREPZ_00225 [Rhodanobacteraceae bacterium]
MSLPRRVDPEWLDTLPPEDPRAKRSRRDLRRINRLMANQRLIGTPLDVLLRRSMTQASAPGPPVAVVELGTGDGELSLRLGRRFARHWPRIDLTLIDLQPVVGAQTLDGYRALGWDVRVACSEVLAWLAQPASGARPIIFANLFVHHFDGERLHTLLDLIARRASAFLCCEPRRSRFALSSSRLLGAIGCNEVTRHDAVVSVRAGFTGTELSALWPRSDTWSLREGRAGWFSHLFYATRKPGA